MRIDGRQIHFFESLRSKAQLSIELAAVGLLIVVFALLVFDIVIVVWGFSLARSGCSGCRPSRR